MTVRVIEFSRTPSDRRRYVHIGALRPEGCLTIVFFRQRRRVVERLPPKDGHAGNAVLASSRHERQARREISVLQDI
jgi:hypothetical protein